MRVLVVDDIPTVAALHGMFVAAHARCVLVGTVATGPDAVAAIRELEPDLVLLDVHLPGFSGLDALRTIRADRSAPQPEVIAVTAARDVDTVRDARLLGVRHYLVKPFTAFELHARIDDVLRERAAWDAAPDALAQDDVDVVMRSVDRRTLPKGLTHETLDLVTRCLQAHPGASSTDVSLEVGLSRVTSRRYLEHLAETGTARRELDYSTAGRPATRYRLAGSRTAD